MIQYLGYSPIQWDSFVANTTVSLSVAEAEYVGAHEAGKMTMSNRNLLNEIILFYSHSTLETRNRSTIRRICKICLSNL